MLKGLKAELRKVAQSPLLTIEVIVLLFVPILYAGIFLKGVWDPYGNMNNIKVAVVNQDQPVQYNGTTLNVGQQVVDTIKKDDTFDWQIMSADDAKQCLHDDKCYMVVTLPKDFSQKAATVTRVNPEKMDLKYETNGSLNYPLETISSSAATQLKSQVATQVTLAYTNAILGTIRTTGNQIQTAANGSRQITDGLATADSGIGEMQSQMPTLQSGVQQLAGGSNTLYSGTAQLATGASELQLGVKQLTSQTRASATALQNSLPQVKQLRDGANQLSDGLSQLNSYQVKLKQLSNDINLFKKEIDTTSQVTSSASYKKLITSLSKVDDSEREALQKLGFTDSEIDELQQKVALLPKTENLPNAQTLQSDLGRLSSSMQQLADGGKQIASGTNQLYNKLSSMSGQLNSAKTNDQLAALNSGAAAVASGANRLNGGAGQLSSGLGKLNRQTPTLVSGVNRLKSGTSQLLNGSSALTSSLQSGADQIKSAPLSDKTANQIADPVKATQDKYSTVKNYGHGLAPYFMSVSLFVGCMLFNFAYPVRKIANRKLGWFSWFLAKFVTGAVSATLMAVITGAIMMGLGLHAQHPGQYFGLLILHANAMMFLIMFLAVAFDNPGRFVAMIILILSLGASAGTFPIETSSAFYQWIHPYLPMTYMITGMREAISSGISQTNFVQCFAVLIGVLIINVALLALSMFILYKWKGSRAGKSALDGKDKLLSEIYG